jgi:acyl-CoA thioesterase II
VSARAASPLAQLLACLDLSSQGGDRFLGDPGPGDGRLYGGMVAAQSAIAAGRTVPADRPLHSLHAYFLRPGRHDVPIHFAVHRIRDGRSFTTRRVVAEQAGEAIFNMGASFARPEEGIGHQAPMPEAPPPDGLPDWEDLRARVIGDPAARREGPVEVRLGDAYDLADPERRYEPRQRNWLRVRGALPEDPLLHAALLVYLSDRTLLATAARPHGLPWGRRMAASLDHAVWIHRPVRLEGWLLYASESPVAHAARGLIFGGIFQEGARIASVAQEALIRVPR